MDLKTRLIAGTINHYPAEEGWANTHLDLSDRPLYKLGGGGFVSPDVVANIGDADDFRSKLAESSFDNVRCHQVFEHLTPDQAPICLENFLWVLKSNGILDIEVPNIANVIGGWVKGDLEWDDMLGNIYGGSCPAMPDDHYNAHRWGWCAETLGDALLKAGFTGADAEGGYQLRMVASAP